jgi:hypothetical protein
VKDDDFAIQKVKGAGSGESALETQAKFYEKLYGDKTPEEIQAAAKANYDKIHAKNVGNLIGQQQFNQTYNPKLEISTTTEKSPLPVNLGFDFGDKLKAKVNDVIDQVQEKVQQTVTTVGDGVQNIAQNIGETVQEGLQDMGLLKEDDDKNPPDAKKVVKDVTDNVTIGTGKNTAVKQTGIANLGGQTTVGDKKAEGGGTHTVGNAADKNVETYTNTDGSKGNLTGVEAGRSGNNTGGGSSSFGGGGGGSNSQARK